MDLKLTEYFDFKMSRVDLSSALMHISGAKTFFPSRKRNIYISILLQAM